MRDSERVVSVTTDGIVRVFSISELENFSVPWLTVFYNFVESREMISQGILDSISGVGRSGPDRDSRNPRLTGPGIVPSYPVAQFS